MAEPRNESRTTFGTKSVKRTDAEQQPTVEKEQTRTVPARKGEFPLRSDPFSLFSSGHPLSLFDNMRRQMDRMFDNFGFGGPERNLWSPQIEMRERDGKLVISADLPGLNKDDVRVEFHESMLTIEGERKHEQRDEERGFSERSYGHFLRSIPLPEYVSADNAQASFRDGVLEITLDAPKRMEPRGKAIEIK